MKTSLKDLIDIEDKCKEDIQSGSGIEEVIDEYRKHVLEFMFIKNLQENGKFMTTSSFHLDLMTKMDSDPTIRDILEAKNLSKKGGVCDIFTHYVTHYRILDSQEKFEETIYDFLSGEEEKNGKLSLILGNLKAAKHKIFTTQKREYNNCIDRRTVLKDFDLRGTTRLSDLIFNSFIFNRKILRLFERGGILKAFKEEANEGDYIELHLRYKNNNEEEVPGHSVVVMRNGDKCVFFDVNVCSRFVIPEKDFFKFLLYYSHAIGKPEEKELCGIVFTNNTKRMMEVEEVEKREPEVEQSRQDSAKVTIEEKKRQPEAETPKQDPAEEASSLTIGTPVKDSKPETEHVKQNIEQPQLGLIAEEVNQAEVLQLEPEEPEAEEVPNPNIDVPTSEEDSKPEENLLQNADQDPGVAATSSTVGTSTTDSTSFNQQLPIKVPVPGIEQAQNPTLVVHTDDQDSNPQEGLLKDADQDPTVEVPSITVNIHEVDPQPKAEPIMTKLPISGADLKSQINDIFPMSQKRYSFENYQSGKGLVELSKERVDIVNKYIESIKKDFIESQFILKITYAQLCIKCELRCLSIDGNTLLLDGNTLLLKEYLEIVKQYNGWVSSIFDKYEKWNDVLRERNEKINRELARIEEILSSKTQKNEPTTEVLQSEPEKSEAEEDPSPTVLTPEGDLQPETQLPNNVISPYATSKETEETDAEFKTYNGEKLKSEAPIYIPVAPSEDKNKNGVRENISYSQEKSKSNSKYYIVGCAIGGAIIGAVIAHCAGAAALTPVLAAVAVFIGAVVVGALLGAGIGYCISKCLDSPDVQSSGQKKELPEFFYT